MNSMLRQNNLRLPDIKPYLRSFERQQPISQEEWGARESKLFQPGCLIFCLEPAAAPSGLSSFSKKGEEAAGESYRVKDLCFVVSSEDGQTMVVNVTASAYEFRTLDSLMVEKARKSILDGRDFHYVAARPTQRLDKAKEKSLYEAAAKYAQGGARRSLTVEGSSLSEPVFALLRELGANLVSTNPQAGRTVVDIGQVCHMIITPEGRQEDKTKSLLRTNFAAIKAADLETLAGGGNMQQPAAANQGLYTEDPAALFYGQGADLGALASEPAQAQAPVPENPAPYMAPPAPPEPEPATPGLSAGSLLSPAPAPVISSPTSSANKLAALAPQSLDEMRAEVVQNIGSEKLVAPEWFVLSHDLVPLSALEKPVSPTNSYVQEALAAPPEALKPEPPQISPPESQKEDFASQFLSDYSAGHAGSKAIEESERSIAAEREITAQEEAAKQKRLREYFGDEHFNTYISESKPSTPPQEPAVESPQAGNAELATFDSDIFASAGRSTLETNPEAVLPEPPKAAEAPALPNSWMSYADKLEKEAPSKGAFGFDSMLTTGGESPIPEKPTSDIETVAPSSLTGYPSSPDVSSHDELLSQRSSSILDMLGGYETPEAHSEAPLEATAVSAEQAVQPQDVIEAPQEASAPAEEQIPEAKADEQQVEAPRTLPPATRVRPRDYSNPLKGAKPIFEPRRTPQATPMGVNQSSMPVTAETSQPLQAEETTSAPVETPSVFEPGLEALMPNTEAPAPVVESAPVFEAPAPVVEAPAPVFEAPAPVVEAPAPVFEAPAPVVEAPAPVVEAPAPIFEAPAPVVEAPAPIFEAPAPVVEAPAPVLETPAPMFEAPAPVLEAPAPVFETPAPVLEAPAPVFETPAPVVEAPAPVFETPAPVVEAPAPVFETPAPVVEAPAPVVEAPAPVVEASAPVIEAPASVVEPPAPLLNTAAGSGGQDARLMMNEMTMLMNKLEQQVSKAGNKLSSRAEELKARLNKQVDALLKEAHELEKQSEHNLSNLLTELSTKLDTLSQEVHSGIQKDSLGSHEILESALKDGLEYLDSEKRYLCGQIVRTCNDFRNEMTELSTTMARKLDEVIAARNKELNSMRQSVLDELKEGFDNYTNTVETRFSRFKERMNEETSSVAKSLERNMKSMMEEIESSLERACDKLTSTRKELERSIAHTVACAETKIANTSKGVLSEQILPRLTEQKTILRTMVADMTKQIGEETRQALHKEARRLEDSVNRTAQELKRIVEDCFVEYEKAGSGLRTGLDEAYTKISHELNQRTTEVFNYIKETEKRVAESEHLLRNIADSTAPDAEPELQEERGNAMNTLQSLRQEAHRKLAHSIEESINLLEEKSESLFAELTNKRSDATASVREVAEVNLERIRKALEAANSAIQSAKEQHMQ
ncbi:MAG: hypothetical protein K2Y32_02360 [Candidatus Obscuribacterales bacterium]|nr:hypothetical protein [Candidatus Obscuribacterales bacterium]